MRISSARRRSTAVAALAVSATLVGGTQVAQAAEAVPAVPSPACDQQIRYKAERYGSASYAAIGKTAGKYNSSKRSSTLTYELSTTKSKSTTITGGGGISLKLGIATIEGNGKYEVTKTSGKGKAVTNRMSVPGKSYGYTQPKVEFRKFYVRKVQTLASCGTRVLATINVKAITADPFFAECSSKRKAGCTPKP